MGGERADLQVYASSHLESALDAINPPDFSQLHFRIINETDSRETTCYFNSTSVLWISSIDKSTHALLHTLEGDYKAVEKLTWFEEKYPDVFLRAHTSFLINPLYARSLTRFELTMTDGSIIPIPQKKYSLFKTNLNNWDFKKQIR